MTEPQAITMKIKLLLIFLAFMMVKSASSQSLFTYGKYSVDAKDFLRAFNKNNTQPLQEKAKIMRDYLNLYINSRLKIREAYDRKFDTLPQVSSEVDNLRKQVSENYMNDPQITPRLQKEAFERSLKDVHIAHIFISLYKNNDEPDTTAARIKKEELLQHLQKGEDFNALAKQYSDDTTTKRNSGDIGYTTVFTLPYEFENAIYNTPVGKYSRVVVSKSGYHIFKNLGERKALGKMKAKQILLAIPPGSDEIAKKKIALLSDSLYKAIQKGSDIGQLASLYSNDYISVANSGTMPDILVGQYEPVFESIVWSLAKDGEVSKPFLTNHGWHIVKRVSIKPVITDSTNAVNKQELMSRLMNDNRWKSSKEFIYKKVSEKPGLKKLNYEDDALWAFSDSLMMLQPMKEKGKKISMSTPVFSIADSIYTVKDWINFASYNRFRSVGGIKPYPQVREEFMQSAMYNYYQGNLETYSEDFRNQMAEFKDGNIFFEIMQQEVWNRAQNDTAALKDLYEKNKIKYTWKQSTDAVIFYCSDESTAKFMYDEIKKAPAAWRTVAEKYAEKVVSDSSRFEWDQLPLPKGGTPKPGMLTIPVVNSNDNSASFTYIFNVYTTPVQRSFTEARGLVINDYQEILEKQWTNALKKKYPVTINEKVFEQISK